MKKFFGVVVGASGLAIVLASAACSTETVDPFASTDSFCQAKATAECDSPSGQGVASTCGATVEKCKTTRISACNSAVTAATSGGQRKYDSSKVDACIAKTKEIYAKRNITPSDIKAQAEVCERVFQGSLAKGASCSSAYACSGTLVCDRNFCAEKRDVNVGDGCANPGEVCAAGSYCADVGGGIRQCKAKVAVGGQCSATLPCDENSRCASGTCAARLGAGESCPTDDDCGTSAPRCDPNAHKCVAGLQLSAGTTDCKDFGG